MFEQVTKSIDKLSVKFMEWLDTVVLMLPNFILAIFLVLLFVIGGKLIKRYSLKALSKFSDNIAINRLITNIIYVVIVVIGLFVALGVLHLDKTVTSLLAGVGVIGLALGFAFQNTAANFISGVFMATKHPINVGDVVSTNNYFGTVKTIDMRYTDIRTPQGQSVIIPNRMILENPLVNYSITGERRVDLSCGISYGDNLEKVKKVAIEAIEKLDVLNTEKPVDLTYNEFGDSSINFILRFWIKFELQSEFNYVQSEAIIALKNAFDENDIMIPFPIRTLDFGIRGGENLSKVLAKKSNDVN